MRRRDFGPHDYLAIDRAFILKVDGSRPLLYSLDYSNTQIYFLSPLEGLALSLLNGQQPLAEVVPFFESLLPERPISLIKLLQEVDQRVRQAPSANGIGADGLFDVAAAPIPGAQAVATGTITDNDTGTPPPANVPANTLFTRGAFDFSDAEAGDVHTVGVIGNPQIEAPEGLWEPCQAASLRAVESYRTVLQVETDRHVPADGPGPALPHPPSIREHDRAGELTWHWHLDAHVEAGTVHSVRCVHSEQVWVVGRLRSQEDRVPAGHS